MRKKLGRGSFSLLFLGLAVLWSTDMKYFNDFCLGDRF